MDILPNRFEGEGAEAIPPLEIEFLHRGEHGDLAFRQQVLSHLPLLAMGGEVLGDHFLNQFDIDGDKLPAEALPDFAGRL